MSADVMLGSDATVVGSFTVDGLTYAVNQDGLTVVSVAPMLASRPDEADSSVVIPSSVTYDGVAYDVTAIDAYAFYLSGATDVVIPASVVLVDERAFRTSDVERVEVADGNPAYSSYDGTLYSADQTSLLLIPEGRAGAVRIPSHATLVDPSVFSHCAGVDAIVVDADCSHLSSEDGLLYNADGTTLLRVPAGAVDIVIRDGCTTIAAGAMEGCAKLERINAPASVTSISPNVFESVPTISLPAMTLQDESVAASLVGAESAPADNFAGSEDEAEVPPRRVVASLMSLKKPLALPDLGSTSASSSANGQLTAMVALSTADGDEPAIDAQKITVCVADSSGISCWEDLRFSVQVMDAIPEATLQTFATNEATTYTITVHPNGHTLRYTYYVRGAISDQGTVNSPCTYTWGTRFHTGSSYFDVLSAESGTYIGFGNGTPGWRLIGFSKYSGGPLFDEGAVGYESLTAYANWLPNVYTITFDSQGGGVVGNVEATYDQDAVLPTPVRAGFAFQGWDTEENGTGTRYQAGAIRNLTTKNNDTITLYAQWERVDFDVSFDVDSEPGDENYPGVEKPDETVNKDAGAVEIEDPKRPGYVFQGWVIPDAETANKEALDQDLVYQGDDGKWYVDASKLPDYATDGRVELTARWTSIISADVPSAVTFYADVVTQGNESREGAASSAFGQSKIESRSEVDLCVVGLESSAVETTDAMLGADSVLKKAASATPATSAAKLLSLYPSAKAWTAAELQDPSVVGGDKAANAVDFDLDDLLLEASFSAEDFTIPAGDTLNLGYRLNLEETGHELDYDALSALEDGQSAAIANISYCFSADPTPAAWDEPLWVKNVDPSLGRVGYYLLDDIKKAADDLSAHSADPTQSEYYTLYKGLLDAQVTNNGEPGVGPYFQLRINGVYWDLQLIGICQDTKSDGSGKAGLTFQMKDVFAYGNEILYPGQGSYPTYMNSTTTNAGGWASANQRQLLRTTFWGYLDSRVQSAIVPVDKYQQLAGGTTAAYLQKTTGESIWLLSMYEAFGIAFTNYNVSEGLTGVPGYEPFQYMAYQPGGSGLSNATVQKQKWLSATSSTSGIWWLRSAISITNRFINVSMDATAGHHLASTSYGISPAFCL